MEDRTAIAYNYCNVCTYASYPCHPPVHHVDSNLKDLIILRGNQFTRATLNHEDLLDVTYKYIN